MENILSIFSQFSDWATGGTIVVVAGIIVTFLRKKKVPIKKILGFGSRITKEIGEAFLETSDAFQKADEAIRDDGTLIESSVKDVIKEGKEAVFEWKDVIMVVKPKK